MHEEPLSPYPHYTWLGRWLSIDSPYVFGIHRCRHVTHHLIVTVAGDAAVRWQTRGKEVSFHANAGGISFFPCDHHVHTLSMTTAGGFLAFDLMIPERQVAHVCEAEGMRLASSFQTVPIFSDTLMEASLLRLSLRAAGRQISEEIGDEIAARQILMRLCVLAGGRAPEWWRDSSVFPPGVFRQLVASIDAHLSIPMSLKCLGKAVGLSPGHFARKFHHSTGESLGRFVNRRRIDASFAMLRGGDQPLLQIALDLGFSSQSHFTRVFSCLTGMTPDSFRRTHRRNEARA
jgi:AraC-like DNA-binding protein